MSQGTLNPEALQPYIKKGTGNHIPANTSIYDAITFKHQPNAILNQNNPIQNQWYTVFETINCRLIAACVRVADVNEDVQVKLTIDGQVYTNSFSAAADTHYYLFALCYSTAGFFLVPTTASNGNSNGAFLVEGRSIKFEVRKITVNGNGILSAAAVYATR